MDTGTTSTALRLPAQIPEQIAAFLTQAEREDPDVLEYLQRSYQVDAEEKQSDPDDWTDLERETYARGDWQAFSRLRGYTEDEISNFGESMRLAHLLDARYGEDFAISLLHELRQLDIGEQPTE